MHEVSIIPDKNNITNQANPETDLENLERQIDQHTLELIKTNQLLQQEITERKRAELITRTLFRITNAVNTTKNLPELYASIHQILGEIIDLSNFFIAIYNRQLKRVSFPYFVDQFDSGSVYADQINEKNSLTGEVILTKKAVFHTKADLQQRVAEKRIIGTAPTAWLGVPLTIEEHVIGVIAAQCYDEPHRFDVIDLDILISVSDQIALAIERKRNEQTIISNEKRYRTIIESIEDGYYEIDLEGKLILVNHAMCTMLGYNEADLLGTNIAEYMTEDAVSKINETFAAILAKEQQRETLEFILHCQSGDTLYVETVVSAIRNEENEPSGLRGVARDITERKIADQFRQAQNEQLQQSQRLKSLGTLAGGIAHDFNNLLMGIQGRTALMLCDISADHPHYSQLKNIEEYVESAASLTTRLLGFARGGKYEVRPVDLNTLADKTIQMFARTKKEITISTHLQKNLQPVEVDSNQIEQVLLNLLVNAGQAMPGGGLVEVTTSEVMLTESEAHFQSLRPGAYMKLTLSDTGQGMDKETMLKIFDPFFTTKPIGHGTGLGLAMVYGIVRNHSGAISVESTVKQGTTFTILLPISQKEVVTEKRIFPTVEKGTETILLVDDEPMIIEVGQAILAALGYDVLTAISGHEALAIYREQNTRISLIITDMVMPQMNGGELLDLIKKINPEAKVLLSSGYSIDGQAREILERGCDGFIQKPFTLSQLSVKIRQILN